MRDQREGQRNQERIKPPRHTTVLQWEACYRARSSGDGFHGFPLYRMGSRMAPTLWHRQHILIREPAIMRYAVATRALGLTYNWVTAALSQMDGSRLYGRDMEGQRELRSASTDLGRGAIRDVSTAGRHQSWQLSARWSASLSRATRLLWGVSRTDGAEHQWLGYREPDPGHRRLFW